ncbi:hypothetical protein cce_5009 [Crocosphaera subtropica ATCC 51142]|uniref:Actin-like protein N-terminal domain-containing protein n=1 Tax=Crocosphaera subtropica (strain ATCC 51142 / BH68) TaxID=43989 RepID=B1X2J4_CROS5|nr:ParM/StbA family protein [Crocosphaera subtropica]ACB54355.1 hypothetical protein cce_5009 [Crocosphaera subtropica ATCC 51142]
MRTIVSFDAGTSGSKIIARYRSVEYPFEVVEKYFVVNPSVRQLTSRSYRSQLEFSEDARGVSGVVSYVDPSDKEPVYWDVGETATRPGPLLVSDRKCENLLAKILGFLGYLVTQEVDPQELMELDLGILLPWDEFEDRRLLASWLRELLQPTVGFNYNGQPVNNIQLKKIDCKPEGYGIYKHSSSFKPTGVLIIGHSDSSWLYFYKGKMNLKLSQTLPETGMHDFLQELPFPITHELLAAKTIYEAGPNLKSKVLAQLTQTKSEQEIELLQQAIKDAKSQYWSDRRHQFKSLADVEQILVSGGTAHYFSKELNQLFKQLKGVQLEWCTSLMDEFIQKFDIQESARSQLSHRFADCFSYYKTFVAKLQKETLVQTGG